MGDRVHSKFLVRATRAPAFITIAASLSLCISCKGAPPKQGAFPPADVGIVTVKPVTLPQSYDLVGQIEPSRRTEVRARVEGVVLERPFTEGGRGHRGPGVVSSRIA